MEELLMHMLEAKEGQGFRRWEIRAKGRDGVPRSSMCVQSVGCGGLPSGQGRRYIPTYMRPD